MYNLGVFCLRCKCRFGDFVAVDGGRRRYGVENKKKRERENEDCLTSHELVTENGKLHSEAILPTHPTVE